MLSMIEKMCSGCIHENLCTDKYKKSVLMHYLSDHPIDHGCEEYQPNPLYIDRDSIPQVINDSIKSIAERYDKKYLYKIFYKLPDDCEMHTLYTESDDQAEKIIAMLVRSGVSCIIKNRWSWEAFIEK